MEHRTCFDSVGRGCGRLLPLSAFHRQGRLPDGRVRYTSLCRDCNNAKKREWREANPERVSAWNARFNAAHADERAEHNRAYRDTYADELNARERERHQKKRAQILARKRAYYRKNRERILTVQKEKRRAAKETASDKP